MITKKEIDVINGILYLQDYGGTNDAYGTGLYNGIELIRATLTKTEPNFHNIKKKSILKLIKEKIRFKYGKPQEILSD